MLIRPALGIVGLLAGLLSACQPGSPGQKGAEQAIVAQEHRALEQWAKGNPLGYLDIAADDVTYFDDIGAHSRVVGLGAMRTYLTSLKGRIPPHRYEILDPKVQLYGEIGILTLRYHAYGADAQPMSRWKATSVYRLVDDQWRIVHAHWSLVKDGETSRSSTAEP
jgi:ketosteroid isomerase-like protein